MDLFRKKEVFGEVSTSEFKRSLTAFQLVLFGVGVVIGAGLFSITGIAAAQNAGPAIVFAFLIAALGSLFAGLCYCELATMIPASGSAYTYAYTAFGELIAWIIGWDLVLEYAIGASTVAISWSSYFTSLLHDFAIPFPKRLSESPWQGNGEGIVNLPALMILAVLTAIMILGIKKSSFFNTLMVILKLVVIFTFIIIGWSYIDPANYTPFIPPNEGEYGAFGLSGILKASGVLFFAYIGFDAISTVAQETKNPARNLPIGMLGSLGVCAFLYILFAYVLTGMVNYKELDVAAPIAVAIDKTPYPWLKEAIKLAVLAGFSSVILVLMIGQSRIFYSMSKDGLLPTFFSHLHPRFKTPWISNIVLLFLAGAFSGFVPITIVGHMTSIGTLFAFVIVSCGVLVLRYRRPELKRPFKTPFVPLVPMLAIFSCGLMIFSLGPDNWLRLIIWMIVGLLIYFLYGVKYSNLKNKT